jgi:hypothetical protein
MCGDHIAKGEATYKLASKVKPTTKKGNGPGHWVCQTCVDDMILDGVIAIPSHPALQANSQGVLF